MSVSRTFPKATMVKCKCTHCGYETTITGHGGGSIQLPRYCNNPEENRSDKCPNDSYVSIPERSAYIDCQYLKIQETPEELNSGDIPKHLSVYMDRVMTEILTAGSRVTITGVLNIQSQGSTVLGSLRGGGRDLGVNSC